MIDFIQNTLDGITIGAGYALLAIGFTLIFGVLRRLNLAYGPSIMIGVFLGTFLYLHFDAGWLPVAIATVIGAILAGIYVERMCFWAIKEGAALASMVSTFAIWMQLEELVTVIFPERTYEYPTLGEMDFLEFAGLEMRVEHLIMLGIAVLMVGLLHVLLYRTRFGLSVRAVSENPAAARFMGINTGRVIFRAFILASAIGGVAGFLLVATDPTVTPKFGLQATFKGLIAMMLGGMGSIPGAIAGGVLLGIVERHMQAEFDAIMRDMAAYALLFLFLIFRPGGIMAQGVAAREAAALRRV
jgi:branched-subunit amino acid ABC-type transport system permease component